VPLQVKRKSCSIITNVVEGVRVGIELGVSPCRGKLDGACIVAVLHLFQREKPILAFVDTTVPQQFFQVP
jgi:hypothetical protein